jgi:hypothetical protein
MAENKRKNISKKLRFEVFKRDNFTCNYCGRMAPDVVLEVDHINPVKHGGRNDILNLITACKSCNSGKGAILLSDNQVIKQQQEQLKQINEKREQLKLMPQWKQELADFENEQIEIIDDMFRERTDFELNSHGFKSIRKVIREFGIQNVIDATEISIDQYYKGNGDSFERVIKYIPGICYNKKKAKEGQ